MLNVSSTQRYRVPCNLLIFCCAVGKKCTTRSILFRKAFNKHRCLRRTVLINWLSNSTKQSPSLEGNNSQQATKFPALWNPKFHCLFQSSPPYILFVELQESVHAIPFYFHKIQFNIILPSTPRSSK